MYIADYRNAHKLLLRDSDIVKTQDTPLKDHRKFDIIPDIHGQLDKLEALLTKLGYQNNASGNGWDWNHPERKVLFLGDYIDRGPQIWGTLRLVRRMVEAGNAIALMGNHEFNAVAYHTKGDDGQPLRPHTRKNSAQHQATLDDFIGRENELSDYIEWFKGLPMFMELDGFRAVHACWSEEHINLLQGKSLHDREFLIKATADKASPEYEAIETVLRGPEVDLPEGMTHQTPDGRMRPEMRIRWWGLDGEAKSVAELIMPPGALGSKEVIPSGILTGTPNLPEGRKPVFFGHYWIPPETPKAPLAPGICCLDFSAGKDGPLVAYRWDGNSILNQRNFVEVDFPPCYSESKRRKRIPIKGMQRVEGESNLEWVTRRNREVAQQMFDVEEKTNSDCCVD